MFICTIMNINVHEIIKYHMLNVINEMQNIYLINSYRQYPNYIKKSQTTYLPIERNENNILNGRHDKADHSTFHYIVITEKPIHWPSS